LIVARTSLTRFWPYQEEIEMTCQIIKFHLTVCVAITATILTAGAPASAGDTDAMLTAHWEAKNANMPPDLDASAIAGLWAADGTAVDALGTLHVTPLTGRDQIEASFAAFGQRYIEISHVEERRCTTGNLAYWEGVIKGTTADGVAFEVPVLFASTFDAGGLVTEERIYAAPPAK
jgi:hypothetical protein